MRRPTLDGMADAVLPAAMILFFLGAPIVTAAYLLGYVH
jgi:hypothetical protein